MTRNAAKWVVTLGWLALVLPSLAPAQTSPLLLVTSMHGNMLSIVDPVAKRIVGRVPTGPNPHGVAVSTDGRLAFTANLMSSSISVIDVAARKEVRRIEVPGSQPHDIQYAGGKVYFTAEGYKAAGRYDPATQQLDFFGLGQEGPHMLAVRQDGKRIFVANRSSQGVSAIEGSGPPDWKVTLLSVGRSPEGIDVTPNGQELWTGNRNGGGVSIIDLVTKKVAYIDTQTMSAGRLTITPDGRYALVGDNDGSQTVVLDTSTRKVLKRFKVTSGAVVVTPDSGRAYLAGGGNHITVLDLKTFELTDQIETGLDAHGIAWTGH